MSAASITFKKAGLGYSKGGKQAAVLQNLDLEFFAGEFVAVVGLNGTGKSTILKSISGLIPLLGGQVLLNGENIDSLGLEAIAKKVAIVLTERVGGFNLTAFDAVAAGQIPYTDAFHRLRAEHIAVIDSAIEQCGVSSFKHKLLHELSDGQFQKAMIAKALAQQTPTILLDEPSAFLDYASKHELFLLLKRLAETENKCILVSTHDLELVLKYCKRLLLVSGNTAELADVAMARQLPAFVKIGGGFI